MPRDPKYGVAKVAHVLAAIDFTIGKLKEYYSIVHEETKGLYFHSCSLGQLRNMKKMNKIEWLFQAECNGKELLSLSTLSMAKMSTSFWLNSI